MIEERRPTDRARALRNTATLAERRLWLALSRRQLANAKFSRQMPIGPYFADFLCRAHKLVVEVDDRSHDLRWREDRVRTTYLEREGYRVIRFTNADVRDRLEGVLQAIGDALAASAHPAAARLPSRPAGGEKEGHNHCGFRRARSPRPSLEMPRALH